MVEAQEGLEPRSLLPCHRLDRCTSGLTIFCTNPVVAKLLQMQIEKKMVDKSYIARVKVSRPQLKRELVGFQSIKTIISRFFSLSLQHYTVGIISIY